MAYFHTTVLDEQIKALPTVDTASGSVATFDTDMTENLIEVVCDIQYSQASGTPTPDNELPIEVYDHLTLYHNSINLWDEQVVNGTINNSTGEISYTGNFWLSEHPISVKPETEYYFKAVNSKYCLAYWYDGSMNYLGYVDNVGSINKLLTSPSNAKYLYLRFFSNVTVYNVGDFSVNYPSTDTQYHAFNGAYIPFGQTVAKGNLNVTTGVLEITHKYVDLGTLSWVKDTTTIPNKTFFRAILNDAKTAFTAVCSNYPFVGSYSNLTDKTCAYVYNNRIAIMDSDYDNSTATDFQTAMSGVQLVYELATPIEIQLSATQITALLNENNIWCDTNGDTEVKFLLTVGKKIS